ncbi:MlaD family protein [Mycobacterium syngnathidarum]
MRTVARSVLWLTIFTTVATVCALIVITALRNPISGPVSRYTASFSDVSGLFAGDDVRISGVQVGKVATVRLDGRTASVQFTVLEGHHVYVNTTAAVRYQNLLGQRYVELVQPAVPDRELANGSTIPIGMTIPSFDVAKLFNGFRPLFQSLDPAQFNRFGENMLRLIQGDETGIGPVLRDLDALSQFAVNRQAVLTTLIHNLSAISAELGGKSQQLFRFIATLNGVLTRFTAKGEEFRTSIDTELPLLRNLVQILQYTERIFDGANVPLYDLLTRMDVVNTVNPIFPRTPTIIAGLNLVPSLVQGLRDSLIGADPPEPDFECAGGEVRIPGIGMVSFAQQNLVVCN